MAYSRERDYASTPSGTPIATPASAKPYSHSAYNHHHHHQQHRPASAHSVRDMSVSASMPGTAAGSPDTAHHPGVGGGHHLRPGSGGHKAASTTPQPLPHTPYSASHELDPASAPGAGGHYSGPITPISGPSYSASGAGNGNGNGSATPYFGSGAPHLQDGRPSPAPPSLAAVGQGQGPVTATAAPMSATTSADGRPVSENFTQDGNPIVPVGISGGKMFQCRGYGQCDKVFTRSEHLARHVRYVC